VLLRARYHLRSVYIFGNKIWEKKFRKTFEKMEGFSFETPVTGLNRPNTGKEDDDDTN
jgi:hypothetical protein